MNEYIDLRKILKGCPKGTILYSLIHGYVEFSKILDKGSRVIEVISITSSGQRFVEHYTFRGQLHSVYNNDECVLFPSQTQRDWSKFTAPWYNKSIEQKFQVDQYITDGHDSGQIIEVDCHCYKILDFTENTNIIIPFTLQDNYHIWTIQDVKDGDVLVNGSNIFIFHFINNRRLMGYCHVNMDDGNLYNDIGRNECFCTIDAPITPATKEQRNFLFQKIKEAGYKWNVESKTLEEKFDPKTLKPFDRVIVRNNNGEWRCANFSHIKDYDSDYRYDCCYMIYRYCIPYNEETKHLVGTTEEAPKYYRYWE